MLCCSLMGPIWHNLAVEAFYCRHPGISFDYAASIDLIRMRSSVDGLFHPKGVPVRVMISSFNLVQNTYVSCSLVCSETAEFWTRARRISLLLWTLAIFLWYDTINDILVNVEGMESFILRTWIESVKSLFFHFFHVEYLQAVLWLFRCKLSRESWRNFLLCRQF